MSLPLHHLSKEPPNPIAAFEASIPVGVSSFEVMSFKAVLIRGGSARVEGNFRPFIVEAGDLLLMRPRMRCASVSLSQLDVAVVQVDPMFLVDQVRWTRRSDTRARYDIYKELIERAQQPIRLHLDERRFVEVAELFAQLVFLSTQSSAVGRTISRAIELIWMIESLLVTGQKYLEREHLLFELSRPLAREEIATALRAIHERYATDLSIRELAQEASLSESAFRRAVVASTGISPREYLHRVRLAHFEELVAQTDLPLAQAAQLVGWSSVSHARAVFIRSHGMPPSEYRVEAQEAQRANWRRWTGA